MSKFWHDADDIAAADAADARAVWQYLNIFFENSWAKNASSLIKCS